MNYLSTVPLESKDFPGVRYVLKRMSAGRRAAFNLAMADYFSRQRDLWEEREPLETELLQVINEDRATKRANVPEDDSLADLPSDSSIELRLLARRATPELAARFDDAKVRRITDLMAEELRLDQDQMQPALVRWGLASLEGIDIDGKPADAESLISAGPPELFLEIASEISRVMRMSGTEAQNLESPSTSGAPVAEAMSGTAASAASATATI